MGLTRCWQRFSSSRHSDSGFWLVEPTIAGTHSHLHSGFLTLPEGDYCRTYTKRLKLPAIFNTARSAGSNCKILRGLSLAHSSRDCRSSSMTPSPCSLPRDSGLISATLKGLLFSSHCNHHHQLPIGLIQLPWVQINTGSTKSILYSTQPVSMAHNNKSLKLIHKLNETATVTTKVARYRHGAGGSGVHMLCPERRSAVHPHPSTVPTTLAPLARSLRSADSCLACARSSLALKGNRTWMTFGI